MIKRITGLVAAAAVIGIIVWTVLGRDKYTSAVFTDTPQEQSEPTSPADSLAMPAPAAANAD